MNRHLVFVYGNLRQGGPDDYILAECELIGPHTTEPRYTMFRLGDFPAVVARGETAIVGEIYRVGDDVFGLLDELQCYPQVFSRQTVHTSSGPAWIYLYNRLVGTGSAVGHGDWLRHVTGGG